MAKKKNKTDEDLSYLTEFQFGSCSRTGRMRYSVMPLVLFYELPPIGLKLGKTLLRA
jgi:hypothetical protein